MTPAVVCVAGTLCSPAIFGRAVDRLGDDTDLDLWSWLTEPGPWDLDTVAVRLVARVVERGGGPVVLVGHSTGGAIVLRAAAMRPALVHALVLANTGAHMRGHGDADAIIDRIESVGLELLAGPLMDRSFSTPPPAALRDRLVEYALSVSPTAAVQALRSQRAKDLTGTLPSLTMPAVVVHGTGDRARSVADAEHLVAGLPHARLVLARGGHCPMWEDPDLFADAVRSVLHVPGASSL